MKPLAFRLAAVVLGLIAGAGLFVVGLEIRDRVDAPPERVGPERAGELRKRLDENPRSLFLYDERISFRLKPGFTGIRSGTGDRPHVTNSRGLIGPEEIPTDEGIRRVLFLGDSVTYGDRVGQSETFASRVSGRAGRGVHVANASCPGWSTHQEIGFFEEYLADVDWDLVVLVFCLNDLVRFEWVYESEEGFRLAPGIRPGGELGELRDSLGLRALKRRLTDDPTTTTLARHNVAALYAWQESRWEEYEEEILGPWLRPRGGEGLLVVAMPTSLQLFAEAEGAPEAVAFYPQRRLREICREAGVGFLDARRAFDRAGDLEALYLDALHPSPLGHRLLAEFLWPGIEERLE